MFRSGGLRNREQPDELTCLAFAEWFAAQSITLLTKNRQCGELIRLHLIQANPDAQLQRALKFSRTPQQPSSLGRLRSVEPVQRTVIAPPTVVRRIVAKPRIAQFIPA